MPGPEDSGSAVDEWQTQCFLSWSLCSSMRASHHLIICIIYLSIAAISILQKQKDYGSMLQRPGLVRRSGKASLKRKWHCSWDWVCLPLHIHSTSYSKSLTLIGSIHRLSIPFGLANGDTFRRLEGRRRVPSFTGSYSSSSTAAGFSKGSSPTCFRPGMAAVLCCQPWVFHHLLFGFP